MLRNLITIYGAGGVGGGGGDAGGVSFIASSSGFNTGGISGMIFLLFDFFLYAAKKFLES